MKRIRAGAFACAFAASALVAPTGGVAGARAPERDRQAMLAGLRAADMRLATIAYRLMVGNVALCDRRVGATGLVIQSLDSYDSDIRGAARRYFRFETPIGIEGVVSGSPAARAGVSADQSLAAIGGTSTRTGGLSLEGVRARLAAIPPGGTLRLALTEGEGTRPLTIDTVPACAGRAELKLTNDLNAATDGLVLQVNSAMLNLIREDDQLAALVAHELAHIVLRHPERLTAADVSRGMFSIFGRNARLIRRTEIEADRLSVVLLANAGYDPRAAVRLWRGYGEELGDGGLFAGTTHLDLEDRIALVEREAALISPTGTRPIVPAWIESRTQPLD